MGVQRWHKRFHTFEIRSVMAEHVCRPPKQPELLATAIEALESIPPCVGDVHLRMSCNCLYLANSNSTTLGGAQRCVSGWRRTICYCCGTTLACHFSCRAALTRFARKCRKKRNRRPGSEEASLGDCAAIQAHNSSGLCRTAAS